MVLINLVLMPWVNYKRRATQRATRVHASPPMLNISSDNAWQKQKKFQLRVFLKNSVWFVHLLYIKV